MRDFVTINFNRKEQNRGINPYKAAAYGAAVQGGIFEGEQSKESKDILMIEKQQVVDKINIVKGENQNQGRKIAKEKFHNNKAEV